LIIFQASTIVGIIALTVLLTKIINDSFGYAIIVFKTDPATLVESATPLEELTKNDLIAILQVNLTSGRYQTLDKETPIQDRSAGDILDLVISEVAKPQVAATYTLFESIFNKDEIIQYAVDNFSGGFLSFRNWVSWDFVTSPQSSDPLVAGVRNAILGSLFTILIAMLFALPMGLMSAIYLEEYARDNWINRVIRPISTTWRGAIDYLRHPGAGGLRARCWNRSPAGNVRYCRLNHRQRAHNPFSRADPGLTGAAIGDHQLSGGHPGGAALAARGQLRAGRDALADGVVPRAAECHPGHADRHHPGDVTRHWRDRPAGGDRRVHLYHLRPEGPFSKFTTLPIQIYQWTSRPQDVFATWQLLQLWCC
jgi:phosphate transport system permease protein